MDLILPELSVAGPVCWNPLPDYLVIWSF